MQIARLIQRDESLVLRAQTHRNIYQRYGSEHIGYERNIAMIWGYSTTAYLQSKAKAVKELGNFTFQCLETRIFCAERWGEGLKSRQIDFASNSYALARLR